jgi:hypothetical protein
VKENILVADIPWLEIKSRWVAVIDLLGFSHTDWKTNYLSIVTSYELALEQIVHACRNKEAVEYAWFSDTFILYSEDDSASSFVHVESSVRHFLQGLLNHGIPFRGGLSCGDFFAKPKQNIYVGEALVEAYKMSECHNWIGFSFTEKAAKQLEKLCLDPDERLNYRFWNIPLNNGKTSERRLCLLLGGPKESLEQNFSYCSLKRMKASTSDSNVLLKYENTLQFLAEKGLCTFDVKSH